jgi:hypothetical protein
MKKLDQFKDKQTKLTQRQTKSDQDDDKTFIKDTFTSDVTKYKATNVNFDVQDLQWLRKTIEDVNKLSRTLKADQSKLIRASLALLREKSPEEILKLLRSI